MKEIIAHVSVEDAQLLRPEHGFRPIYMYSRNEKCNVREWGSITCGELLIRFYSDVEETLKKSYSIRNS